VAIGNLGVWTTELRCDSAESRDAAAELDDLGFGAVETHRGDGPRHLATEPYRRLGALDAGLQTWSAQIGD
jgi:hypothetical protein